MILDGEQVVEGVSKHFVKVNIRFSLSRSILIYEFFSVKVSKKTFNQTYSRFIVCKASLSESGLHLLPKNLYPELGILRYNTK